MSDSPAQIARDAKALQQGLKEFIRTRDILDREIDIQRKNLRRQYLRLILLHPYARESKDAENHLWMQTSYTIISIYKQRLTALDRAIHNPTRQQQNQPHNQPVVEHRRLLQRFRQFLSDEEKFWTNLVLRLRRNFAVDDAQQALVNLGLVSPQDTTTSQTTTNTNGDAVDAASTTAQVTEPINPNRRNQFQFPPESETPNSALLPSTQAQRESRLAIVCKAIICLGDIARYKELYNEAGGRPRAGHEDGPSAILSVKASRGKRANPGHPTYPRARDYRKAQECYEEARLLIPNDGNPSHQLAVIASYKKDVFESLFHYYRALCVRVPYDTASENLGSTLQRCLHAWKMGGAKKDRERQIARENGTEEMPRPPHRVAEFKEKLGVLHAQWRFGESDADGLAEKVAVEYEKLVTELVIPADIISKVIILSQGALWKHRMIRQPSERVKLRSPLQVETRIVSHLLALHRALLGIAAVEVKEKPEEDAPKGDLAQRITAKFRRMLPALRMSGKWVRGNLRYLSQARRPGEPPPSAPAPPPQSQSTEAATAGESVRSPKGKGRDGGRREAKPPRPPHSVEIHHLPSFWKAYIGFVNALTETFPVDDLPRLAAPLEEDLDVLGFLPLKKFMMGDLKSVGASRPESPKENGNGSAGGKGKKGAGNVSRDQVHPNEEQLMRIWDMHGDAKAVSEDDCSPIKVVDGKLIYTGPDEDVVTPPEGMDVDTPEPVEASAEEITLTEEVLDQNEDDEDDAMTESGRTEDEIVKSAFSHLDGTDEEVDDDDDEIVWNPRVNLNSHDLSIIPPPDPVTPQHVSPVSPKVLDYTPPKMAPPQPSFTSPETKKASPTAATRVVAPPKTAQDLLLGITRPQVPQSHSQHMRVASSPGLTTPLLFGGSTSSIWAPTPDTDPFNYTIGTSRSNIALNGGAIHNSPPAPLQSLQSAARSPPSISQVTAWNGGTVNPTSPTQRSQPQQSTQLQQQQQGSQFLGHSSAVGFIPPQVQGKFGPGHLRGVSESLVGSRKMYQPSSPPHPPSQPMQQLQQFQQQQQQNAQGMNRRVDVWPPAGVQEQVGGFGGNGLGPVGGIGGGLPHSQAQPTSVGMQTFSDTIYAASPNANTGFYHHHSQPSQSTSQGQLLSQGSQPTSQQQQQLQMLQAQLFQQQQQQQQLGPQHMVHSGHGMNLASVTTNGRAAQFGGSSGFGSQRGFATAPYLSSSSIWGNPG